MRGPPALSTCASYAGQYDRRTTIIDEVLSLVRRRAYHQLSHAIYGRKIGSPRQARPVARSADSAVAAPIRPQAGGRGELLLVAYRAGLRHGHFSALVDIMMPPSMTATVRPASSPMRRPAAHLRWLYHASFPTPASRMYRVVSFQVGTDQWRFATTGFSLPVAWRACSTLRTFVRRRLRHAEGTSRHFSPMLAMRDHDGLTRALSAQSRQWMLAAHKLAGAPRICVIAVAISSWEKID